MIDFETALSKIFENVKPLPTINRTLSNALGFVLAEEIRATDPIPLFNSSAVDGYAVRSEDTNDASGKNRVRLKVVGIIRAGDPQPYSIHGRKKIQAAIQINSAVKILTGAPFPKGVDAIVMNEDVEVVEDEIIVSHPVRRGENIRLKGEEFNKGDLVFCPGTMINPAVIGMLATLGVTNVRVHRKPRVAIVATGSELRSPSSRLRPGQIRDSNSYALSAALRSIGVESISAVRVKDNKKELKKILSSSLKKSDVLIPVGGVSAGDYDIVKDVLADLKVETVYWKIAMKPGKPNYFGVRDKKLCFGLPGNPVAALLSFHILVKPAISHLMGIKDQATPLLNAKLGEGVKKKPGREEFLRAMLSIAPDGGLIALPLQKQGSHMMGGLAAANCIIHLKKEQQSPAKGEAVEISLLNWNSL